MKFTDLIATFAIIQFLFFGAMTGRARRMAGLQAPAVSGNAAFERMYRVQMNTLELLIALLPALFLAGKYWSTSLVPILGIIYLIGRFTYWRAYLKEPSTRFFGFLLSLVPVALLTTMALIGIALSLMPTGG